MCHIGYNFIVVCICCSCNGHYQISLADQQKYAYHDECKFDFCFCIHGLSPNQILYASRASSEVHIHCFPHVVKGKILRNYDHDRDILCFGVNGPSAQSITEKLTTASEKKCFKSEFQVKHSYFNSLHRSLNQINKEVLRRIMPLAEDFEEGLKAPPKSNFPVNELDVLQTMAFSKCTAPRSNSWAFWIG